MQFRLKVGGAVSRTFVKLLGKNRPNVSNVSTSIAPLAGMRPRPIEERQLISIIFVGPFDHYQSEFCARTPYFYGGAADDKDGVGRIWRMLRNCFSNRSI